MIFWLATASVGSLLCYYVPLLLIPVGLCGILWIFYLQVLCIHPSRIPRVSPDSDTQCRLTSYPPPYPNGWFHLMDSSDILPGEVKQVDCLGRKFALFRGNTDRKITVVDAHCPHNGASLACGKVVANNIQCPFHEMEFDQEGKVVKIPWLEKYDVKGSLPELRLWTVVEWCGMICLWFDAEKRAPLYQLPPIKEIADKSFVFRGAWKVDRAIRMHLQEFIENTVDIRHFKPMHGGMCIPWTTVKIPGIDVNFAPDMVLGSEKKSAQYGELGHPEYLYFINESSLKFMGKDIPKTEASVVVQVIGPATFNRFWFKIPDLGEIVMFQTHRPNNEHSGLSMQVRFRWYSSPSIPSALASYVVGEWISNWWADVRVWEEKIRLLKPALVRGDGPIYRGRKFFNQFYTENSEKVGSPKNYDW